MLLINGEINLLFKKSENCFLVAGTVACQGPTFTTTDIKFNTPVITYQFKIK